MILGYVLAWHWQKRQQLLRPVDSTPPLHWTERDRQAWKLVETRAQGIGKLDPDKLTQFEFFVDTARDMAQELAVFYHPGTADPLSALTIPELLAVIELAAHDDRTNCSPFLNAY